MVKWLHAFFAILITFEVMSELDMKAIWKRKGELHFRHLLFHAHMWIGMATALVVALFWIQIYYKEHVRSHLFPYQGEYLKNICADISGLAKGCLPATGVRGGLPGLIQGLGLLAVTGMAATGFVMFFLIPNFGAAAPVHFYQIPKKIHDYLSELVWIFWWLHAGVGVVHFVSSPKIPAIFKT